MKITTIFLCCVVFVNCRKGDDDDEDVYTSMDPSKREPTPCEICKYFVTEFQSRLKETDTKQIIDTGHGLDRAKRIKYKVSDLRLIESLEDPHICDKIVEYNVHAERAGSRRYAKGMSETFQALHGLVDKGVKVELGIPEPLWDNPSAEVVKMQRACYKLAEDFEEHIHDWYYNKQDQNLMDFICTKRYLPSRNWKGDCLEEEWTGVEKVDFENKNKENEDKDDRVEL